MAKRTDMLYRLARFLAGVPPEALGAMFLIVLMHLEFVAALFALALFVLKFVLAAIIGDVIVRYLGKMLGIHVWPKLPGNLRRLLRRTEDRALLRPPDQDRPTPSGHESTYSRHSRRHPHW